MIRLIHAELFGLRTTRTTWGLLLGAFAPTGLVLFPTLHRAGVGGTPSLGTPHSLETILAAPRFALYFSVLLGTLAVAGEYRHKTITSTFLATPKRVRVVLAKLTAYGMAGLAFGAAVTGATLLIALGWHAARGVPFDLVGYEVGRVVVGHLLVDALFAMIGVGVGALVRNQAAAMVGVIVWLQIVELSLLTGIVPRLFQWTLTGAALALAGVAPPSRTLGVLPAAQGGLLLVAYALMLALGAARFTVRRDVA
jgi:hypothetical protein